MADADITQPGAPGLTRRLLSLRLFYLMAGIGISAWAIIVPFAKLRFHLDDATLGTILMTSGTGGVLAMPFAGPLIARFGSRAVLMGAGLVFAVTLSLLNLAPSVPSLIVLLFIFGAAFGAIDVAMNAQAVVAEADSRRLLMSGFHAMYSIGSLAIALGTSLLLKAGFSNVFCGILSGLLALFVLPRQRELVPRERDLPAGPAFALPNRPTLLLGLCCFACFLTEGAVTDWSTVFLHFSRQVAMSSATLGYAGFSVMMALSRLMGDRLATKLGKPTIWRGGALLAALGLLLVVLVPWPVVDIVGFALVGAGAGNISPLIFSAAARVPGVSASLSVPAVVSLGYIGFLTGPVLIGEIADHSSLSVSLALDALMMGGLALAARAAE
jgi:MFS family permease